MPRLVARTSAALVLSLAATAAWISPAALAASARPVTASPSVAAITGGLTAVAATSASNAWAVGTAGSASLSLHWNGHSWARVSAPGQGLSGVAASSARNVWAVGEAASKPLILHWNGRTWIRTSAPVPARAFLYSIATSSGSNAWAVGSYFVGAGSDRTLTLHWNGHSWKRVASANPRPRAHTGDLLASVAIVSARNVWAVGSKTSDFAGEQGGLIEHWNGRSWAQASAKSVTATASGFTGVVATSSANVWTSRLHLRGRSRRRDHRALEWPQLGAPGHPGRAEARRRLVLRRGQLSAQRLCRRLLLQVRLPERPSLQHRAAPALDRVGLEDRRQPGQAQ